MFIYFDSCLFVCLFQLAGDLNGCGSRTKQDVLERTVRHTFIIFLNNTVNNLHGLTMLNYVPCFPWLHHLPWLLWLNNGSNYSTNCSTRIVSYITI
jgi:hypothetical protein